MLNFAFTAFNRPTRIYPLCLIPDLSLQASLLLGHFIREENSFLVSYETQVTPEDLKAVNAANQSTPSVLNFSWR